MFKLLLFTFVLKNNNKELNKICKISFFKNKISKIKIAIIIKKVKKLEMG